MVLSQEVTALLQPLSGTMHLIVTLLYGAGLQLDECLGLRVKDLDFDRDRIVVRQGKGQKDRATVLPASAKETLPAHLTEVRGIQRCDRAKGFGQVRLPHAIARKSPAAATDWGWQFVSSPGTTSVPCRGCSAIGTCERR